MEKSSTRVALAFAYDGTRFDSFARQPGQRTVEGEMISSLTRNGFLRDARVARYEVASRTDRGVSAWWNVCAFDTDQDPRAIPHTRDVPEGLHLLSAVKVRHDFSPRREAVSRTYSYHLRGELPMDWPRVRAASRIFVGRHDFRNFCRRDDGVEPVRSVTRIKVVGRGQERALRFEAPSFLWEQVRRIAHALIAAGRKERTLSSIRSQLEGRGVAPEPPAPAEPLVLEGVETDVVFPAASGAATRRIEKERSGAWARWMFHEGLAASAPTRRR